MSFEHGALLWGLTLLLPGIFHSVLRYRARLDAYRGLLVPDLGPSGADLGRRYFRSAAAFTLSMACLVIALAGPRWGYRLVTEYRRGVDVVFALDLSRSMNAQDVAPSRLGRAADLAAEVVDAVPGIRFAAALGKGTGVLAIPLTEDPESIAALLEGVSSSSLSSQGTDLERLLDAASAAFQGDIPTRRRIVLFSDGETLSGSFSDAVERLRSAGIAVVAVALGTEEGAPIPAGESGWVLRGDGSKVVSSLHQEALRGAADRTGGLYVDGSRSDAAALVAAHLLALSSAGAMDGYRRESASRRHLFLLAALLLLAVSKAAERGAGRRP